MTDQAAELSDLSRAFDRANDSITRTGQSFGELAKSSQKWNIISRILSGTGMWRLQNQIRAVGNIINVYHTAQEESMKATLKAVDANMKLAESFKDIEDALSMSDKDKRKHPLAMMFSKAGLDGLREFNKLYEKARERILEAQGGLAEGLRPNPAMQFLMGETSPKEYFSETLGINKIKEKYNEFNPIRSRFETGFDKKRMMSRTEAFTKMINPKGLGGVDIAKGLAKLPFRAIGAVFKGLSMVIKSVARFFLVGAVFVGKALLFFLAVSTGIALLIFLIKKMDLVGVFRRLEERMGGFKILFSGLVDLFKGFFKMFQGAFRGDGGMLFEGFLQMGKGIVKILTGLLIVAFQTILTIIGGVLNGFIKILNKVPFVNIPTFADGGVSGGGLAIVGERGPELVRLPSGARVHSNAESRRMSGAGGGTIHVHVNGRVGASDAEIRDIANKVAREINLKMNRTAHTTGRL